MDKLCEGYGLIEGPVWVQGKGLIFSDVLNGGVYIVDPSGNVSSVFEHRRGIGGMSVYQEGGLVVSGRNIAFKPFDGGATVTLLDRDEAAGIVGFNDITTDAAGRIYAGSLGSSPVFDDGLEPRAGDLYLIDLDGSSKKVATDIRLNNGLGFSPDGGTLYHSDTRRQTVHKYAVHEDGTLGEKQVFARIGVEQGGPDGLAVSEDGRVWVALAGGSGVGVFDPSGGNMELLEIPQPMCTSVCFGGEDLKDLYIVSGSLGSSEDIGTVFRQSVDVAGLPVPPARVAIDG